jgi:hypothetical protein
MGWYIRKAFRAGPLRLNLSKSGLGVSAGVKGFRVGTGPRGAYVHGGRGGLYFRQKIGGPGDLAAPPSSNSPNANETEETTPEYIATADASELVEKGETSLVAAINTTLDISAIAPLMIVTVCVLFISSAFAALLYHVAWLLVAIAIGVLGVCLCKWSRSRDVRLKTIHLWFDLSDDAGLKFQAFEKELGKLASCERIWRVTTKQEIDDLKRNAGASTKISRSRAILARRLPNYFESNLQPYAMEVGDQTLYFFPDQVLVYEGRRVGSVSYDALAIEVGTSQFRETDSVPSDCKIIEYTWQYVNKKGGPDRRFKNNSQVPVCCYGTLAFRSATGLNIHLLLSNGEVGEALKQAERGLIPLKSSLKSERLSFSRDNPIGSSQAF